MGCRRTKEYLQGVGMQLQVLSLLLHHVHVLRVLVVEAVHTGIGQHLWEPKSALSLLNLSPASLPTPFPPSPVPTLRACSNPRQASLRKVKDLGGGTSWMADRRFRRLRANSCAGVRCISTTGSPPRLLKTTWHPQDWDLEPLPHPPPQPSDLTHATVPSLLTRAW